KLRKAIVAHNQLRGINPSGTYHSLKLHSGGLTTYTDAYKDDAWYSEQVVVANNLFGDPSDTNQWTVAICPQNDTSAEGVTNVLIQNNTFIRNSHTSLDLALGGRDFVIAGNRVLGGHGRAPLWVAPAHTGALPLAWRPPLPMQSEAVP
ncbi:hypothetical protein, partial [Ideonella oryzae]